MKPISIGALFISPVFTPASAKEEFFNFNFSWVLIFQVFFEDLFSRKMTDKEDRILLDEGVICLVIFHFCGGNNSIIGI